MSLPCKQGLVLSEVEGPLGRLASALLTFRFVWELGVPQTQWRVFSAKAWLWCGRREALLSIFVSVEAWFSAWGAQILPLPSQHSSQVILPQAVMLLRCRGNDVNPCRCDPRVTCYGEPVPCHPSLPYSFLPWIGLPSLPRPRSLLQAPHSHRSS
ncbi:hypothetical protein E2C01_009831 [Portunus trituberculatus]|uniref:Uncharacterized protein n=1 Tax=Portunus trituberculatus TaxID=210409 RepID=A0A5B7D725_PORTR|nr:hypothetical protein [Portunus trituberculatus]